MLGSSDDRLQHAHWDSLAQPLARLFWIAWYFSGIADPDSRLRGHRANRVVAFQRNLLNGYFRTGAL